MGQLGQVRSHGQLREGWREVLVPPAQSHPAPIAALPIRIVRPLRDKTVLAQHKATLECTVSHARGRVRWFRGDTEIFGGGDKYEICNLDCYRTLVIHHVGPEDEATYTCDALDDRSSARLLVEGEGVLWGAPGATAGLGVSAMGCGRGSGLAAARGWGLALAGGLGLGPWQPSGPCSGECAGGAGPAQRGGGGTG